MTIDNELALQEVLVTAPIEDGIAALRADFEAKFLAVFGSDVDPIAPLKRRVITDFVHEWALSTIGVIHANRGVPMPIHEDDPND